MTPEMFGLAAVAVVVAGATLALRRRRHDDRPALDASPGAVPEGCDLPGLAEPSPTQPTPAGADRSLAVLAIQVSGVAAVNERLGDGTGQRALTEVGRTVRQALRLGDSCERVDADRFVAVLAGLDGATAAEVALRVQRAVASLTLVTHSGDELHLGVAVGRACAPEDGRTIDELRGAATRDLERAAATRQVEEADLGPAERLRRAVPVSPN